MDNWTRTGLKFRFPAAAPDIANYKLWAYAGLEKVMFSNANHILPEIKDIDK